MGSFLEQRLVRRPAVSFQEQRITIEPARRPAVVFLLLVVCSCGRVMTRGGGGTPLYKVYRYVPPQRVWFLSRFGLKTGIDFDNYGLKSGRVFGVGNIHESLQTYFSSQYVAGTTN